MGLYKGEENTAADSLFISNEDISRCGMVIEYLEKITINRKTVLCTICVLYVKEINYSLLQNIENYCGG